MTWRLSSFSLAIVLAYGLTLLLIHLGDTRVLTRHEALAAQPGREMLHEASLRHWIVPHMGGVRRENKPPGMMWLISLSIYVFRDESEFFARLPAALAGLASAILIAKLGARWFGNFIGRLAGLIQLSSVYLLTQAKLAESDMAVAASVCAAMYLLATGVIDAPAGLRTSRLRRFGFWMAIAAAFLLKGPIGVVFITLTVIGFAIVKRDGRVLRFIAEPVGIVTCLVLMLSWPLAALHIAPEIGKVWRSEVIGTATGKWGNDPIYYYLISVPIMLLPWTPLTVLGLWRGPNAELAGPVMRQADRAAIWKFLLCWFVMGILFLSLGMRAKSDHYAFPILPALSIPTALGMDYYVRRQTSRGQKMVWPFFLAACAIGAIVVWELKQIDKAMKPGIEMLLAIFTAGGLASLYFERVRRPGMVLVSYFMTAWAVGIGVQSWLMPAQDDFAYQAHFAREASGLVPPGDMIYLLGHRQEEQESEYSFYLRFPMQRLSKAEELAAIVRAAGTAPVYAIVPEGFIAELNGVGTIQSLGECKGLREKETENDRLRLLRITADSSVATGKY